MRNSLKSLIILPIAAILLAGCNGGSSSGKDDWGIDKDESGGTLINHLHEITLEKHKTYVYYKNFSNYVAVSSTNPTSIDMSGEDNTKNELFYTKRQINNKSTSWTREHVWACANSGNLWVHDKSAGVHYVDGSTYKGGGSDLYHVRPCTSNVNTARGNAKLYEFPTGETYVEVGDGGSYKLKVDKVSSSSEPVATVYEPADAYKGDVARTLMYVYIHYNKMGNDSKYDGTEIANYLGSLKFTDVFNSKYTIAQCQQILVKWNNLDPVSETEKLRNNTVEKLQGNRNPFVDHPEYMARCFEIEE